MPAEIDAANIEGRKPEHLCKAVTIGKAWAILAACILHFGEVSMPEAAEYLKEEGILIDTERT
jgi:imidazole glycerol phosphate synthase subunit HisF